MCFIPLADFFLLTFRDKKRLDKMEIPSEIHLVVTVHRAVVSSSPSALRHPVDMKAIHLKLPNEKQNEANLTERGFCEREGEQDGRWPSVSNVISIVVDGCPMWVSCTRASGCLQSYMIYIWLLEETPHTLTCTHIH